jgi:hypothetical protein
LRCRATTAFPLIAEAFADLETPLSLYLKLAHAKGGGKLSFLLESGGGRRALRPLQLHRPAGAHFPALAAASAPRR